MSGKKTKSSKYKVKDDSTKDMESKDTRYSSKSRKSKSDNKGNFTCSLGRPTNDPRWYLNNPVLSRDVGSLWFSKPTGSYLPKSAIYTGTPSVPSADQYEPGILAIPTICTWGGNVMNIANDVTNDPLNLTAQKLYQYVVHANSRNISYDKKDLMMTLMAIDGVYQVITEAIRAYRLIASYDPENKFVNRLLEAMNWDPTSLRLNVAEFRYYINWAITRVNKFYVPGIFDIVKAHMSAYEYIYADRPSSKAQYIVKYSKGFWLYDDVNGDLNYMAKYRSPGGLVVDWLGSKHTMASFKGAIEAMISGIENAQYLGVMQGDLLKAFGVGNLMQYAYLGIDMPIAPVYDEEFMLKLHNADIAQWVSSSHALDANNDSMMVYRDDNAVSGNMMMLSASTIAPSTLMAFRTAHGMMVDLPTHIPPTADNVLLMSLYKLLGTVGTTQKWRLSDGSAITCYEGQIPPELLCQAKLYYDPGDMTKSINVNTWTQSLDVVSYLSRFETTPLITQEGVVAGSEVPIFWKTDNVSDISWETVRRMFEVVYWSLWASSAITSTVSREERV